MRRYLKPLVVSLTIALGAIPATRAASAPGVESQFLQAARDLDLDALTSLAGNASRGDIASASRGVLMALHGEDAAAIRTLTAVASSKQASADVRFEVLQTLASVYHRGAKFVKSAQALKASLALRVGTPEDVASTEAALVNDALLAEAAPMSAMVSPSADVHITRNPLELPTAAVHIDEEVVQAVLDTGAANSVVSQSMAKRLKLRMLGDTKGSARRGDHRLAARFAVADSLDFAGGKFRSVPFIVLDDAALEIETDSGKHSLNAIIGLPVLRQLGRLEFRNGSDGETLHRTSGGAGAKRPGNLLLVESMPVVLVRIEGGATPMRMALDTGANRSVLTPLATSERPELLSQSTVRESKSAGAGGTVVDSATRVIRSLSLDVGGSHVALKDVYVAEPLARCHGVLGQDVLRSGAGYAIDFESMNVELLRAGG